MVTHIIFPMIFRDSSMPIYIPVPSTSCLCPLCKLCVLSRHVATFSLLFMFHLLFAETWDLWPFPKTMHYAILIASLHNPGNLVIILMTLQEAHITQNWVVGHNISVWVTPNEILSCFSYILDLGQAWTIPFRIVNPNILKYQVLISHISSEADLEVLSEKNCAKCSFHNPQNNLCTY
jgi:hypothetical protein